VSQDIHSFVRFLHVSLPLYETLRERLSAFALETVVNSRAIHLTLPFG